jgi:hypothetical protein
MPRGMEIPNIKPKLVDDELVSDTPETVELVDKMVAPGKVNVLISL